MKRAGMLVGLLVVVGSVVVAQARPEGKPRAVRCFEAGQVFGHQFEGLSQEMRNRGEVLLNFCAAKKDGTLGRIPTETDVDQIVGEMQGRRRVMEDGAHLKTDPLKNTMREGRGQESELLDQLLK
jgi:hypothetical protein